MLRRVKWPFAMVGAAVVAVVLASCSYESPVAPDAEIESQEQPTPQARGPEPVPDEYIVIFRDDRPVPPGLARQLAGDHGLEIRHEYRHAVNGFAAHVPPQALPGLLNNPFVERIEPNLVYSLETPTADAPLNGLRVHLVADDLGPGDVASWSNRGSDGDATQPDASRRPTWLAPSAAFNGHAAVGFNEGSDNDEVLTIDGVTPHGSATILAVVRQEDANRHNYGLATMYGGKRDRASAITRYKAGTVEYWDSDSGWTDGTAVLNAGQTYVVVWRIDGGNVADMQVDGAAAGSGSLSGPIPPFDRYLFGMTEPSSSSRYDGWLAEILVYDRVLDDCERDGIVAELGSSYGVALPPGFGCSGSPPSTPGTPNAVATSPYAVSVDWFDASPDETGFSVERSTGGGGWSEVATTGADESSYADTGLAPETDYCYRIRAFNGAGYSGYSGEGCATTESVALPDPPIDVPASGLRMRLVANDLPEGDVATWPNRGSEGDALQGDPARRPMRHPVASAFGGNAYVGFNEGSDNDEALEVGGVSGHTSGTLIAVVSQEDATAHNYGLFGTWQSASSRSGMVTRASSTGNGVDYWDSDNGWMNGSMVLGAGVEYVVVWRIEAGVAVDVAVNGSPAGSAPLASGFPGFDRYIVGMTEPSTSTRFDGRIAEILFYDEALSDCVIDPIVADLGGYYGISVTPGSAGCAPPAAPTGVSAQSAGPDGVDVTWVDASSNESGFRIERRVGPGGTWSQITEVAANQTSYGDTGLASATEYCYRVQAVNADGASAWSTESCATTDDLPSLPGPVAVPETGLRVRLVANDLSDGDVGSWTNRGSEADAAQPDANRRPTWRTPSSLFNNNASVAFNEGVDDDEALLIEGVSGHTSGTLVAVFAQDDATAHNYGIFGAWGSSASRSGMVTRANSTADGVDYWDAVNGWVGGSTVVAAGQAYVATWRIAAGQAADIRVNGAPGGAAPLATGFPGFDRYVIGMTEPNTSTRFDGRIAELLFYDRPLVDCELDDVVASLGGRYGVSVSATGGGCNPPADPTGLSATAVGYNGVDLAWIDNSGNEDGFRVERRVGQAGSWQQIALTGPDATTYESRGLIQQTEYCYRVVAFNDDGTSAYTGVECATTEAAPPGACVDSGGHDDLSQLYGIQAIGAPANQVWASTQVPGCEITPWYFGLDSGIDGDHPDLNVVEVANFVAAEPGASGEDGNGHGTHTAGSAAARDGNGGVVGVAPGAPIHSFRVCEDGGSCQTADMVAAMDEVIARKLANPDQPMVANMSIGGPVDEVIDLALRNSINAGIVYAVAAGNGILGACLLPNNAANVSPARVGDDEIDASGGSVGNDGLINGVLTTTSHNANFSDVNCNYGAPVSVAAPGLNIRSTWLNGGYNTISGTSMATPHAAGAALLYLQSHPDATPAEVEAAIVGLLLPWSTNDQPNASGRLNVDGL